MAVETTFIEALKRTILAAPSVGVVLTGGVTVGEAGLAAKPPYAVIEDGAARHSKFSHGKMVDATLEISAVAKDAATAMLGKQRLRDLFDADPEIEISDSEAVREVKILAESAVPKTRHTAVGIDFVAGVTVQFKLWKERLD